MQPNLRLTSPQVTSFTMAKSRVTTNPMYVGGAGGYSFYVRGGEQVIRQRKNNSNYGDSASRTRAQMIRRIRWGNLVNVFKSQKYWQPKAYDSKTKGQTDYNIFMSLNINQATVGFTKEMCEAGCAVIEGYQVSRGSLPPISLSASQSGNQYVTDIKISNAIQGGTTVGQLAADILANNSQFVEGDNIAFVFFRNWKTARTEWPYASSVYAEITLDTTSTTVINSIPALDNRLSKSTGGFLQASWSSAGEFEPTREVGFVAIHTRKSASMLQVSSQEILMNSNSLALSFSSDAWLNQCILSYGLTDEVPLDPSFKGAVIRSVTANGSEVTNLYGHVVDFNEAIVLIIEGDGLNSSNLWMVHDDVRYCPLSVDDDGSWTYILSENGINKLYLNGTLYGVIRLSSMEVPAPLPVRMAMAQLPESSSSPEAGINPVVVSSTTCINYPHVEDENYPWFALYLGGGEEEFPDSDEIVYYNCTGVTSTWAYVGLKIALQVSGSPAYVVYKNVIIAVFNYEG